MDTLPVNTGDGTYNPTIRSHTAQPQEDKPETPWAALLNTLEATFSAIRVQADKQDIQIDLLYALATYVNGIETKLKNLNDLIEWAQTATYTQQPHCHCDQLAEKLNDLALFQTNGMTKDTNNHLDIVMLKGTSNCDFITTSLYLTIVQNEASGVHAKEINLITLSSMKMTKKQKKRTGKQEKKMKPGAGQLKASLHKNIYGKQKKSPHP